MLGHIGKLLRSAGYDTRIDKGLLRDSDLVSLAKSEGRIFLTCDHEIPSRNEGTQVLYLPENSEAAWTKLLFDKAHVNWLHAPFSRCLDCNSDLQNATGAELDRVPENVRREGKRALYCPTCDKVYWDGSHVTRMRTHLDELIKQTLFSIQQSVRSVQGI